MEKFRGQIPSFFFGQALEKAVNLCGMVCCHDAEASSVYATCQAFSPNNYHKNPQYSYAGLLIHKLAVKKKIPFEELPHCSRKQKTCS